LSQEFSPVQPGDLVGGKYRVERTLGAGGMGVVVAAIQIELDRRVALKFLLPKVLERPGLITRFSREARAVAKLESEHVARVLDVGMLEGGGPYIVMEYLEGEDLARVVASRGAMPSEQAVGYLLQACEAVAEAHSLGIVHRDLKPGNLFLANRASGPQVIKVLDFGLSKFASSEEANVTSESSILGSPLYMSPEQLMSARTADARSDIWSLGIVLYELLTAHTPFQFERIAGLVAAILQKPPQPIDEWRTGIPPGLQAVVATCLEKDPLHRFPSVAHLAKALAPFGPAGSERSVERIVHVLRIPVPSEAGSTMPLPPAPTELAAGPAPAANVIESVAASSRSIRHLTASATLASGPSAEATRRRRRLPAALVGGVAVSVAVIGAFVALSRPPHETDRALVVSSQPVAMGRDGATLAPAPAAELLEAAAVGPQVSASASAASSPPRATPAESGKKRVGTAPAVSTPTASALPVIAPPAPSSPIPDDPLRRLRPM
jgi:eukaryotic-like serine/threonine-protein kinase